jgi:acyl carrier protein
MSDRLRKVVIEALNKASGALNEPEMARTLMSGGDVPFAELDMDSLTMFEMIMDVEEKLGIELDADQVASKSGVDEFVSYLKLRTA